MTDPQGAPILAAPNASAAGEVPPAQPVPPAIGADPAMPNTNLLVAVGQWFRVHFNFRNLLERRATWVVLGVGVMAAVGLKVAVLPAVASRAVSVISEGYGVDMEVGDWSAGLFDFSASAQDVVVKVPGTFAQSELLTIDELVFDLSLWQAIRGKGWLSEVRVLQPKLYLERHPDGSWNWHELGSLNREAQVDFEEDAEPTPSANPAKGGAMAAAARALPDSFVAKQLDAFNLKRLRIEGMRLEWVEVLPGNSGGGLIHEQKATMFFDDMEIAAQDVVGLLDLRPQPTRLKVAARTADGKISLSGQANLFHWSPGAASPNGAQKTATAVAWSPNFNVKLYLENIGAGGFARLTPEVAIRPVRGSMSGTVDLALNDYQLDCTANVELVDVSFSVNRSSPLLARKGDQIEAEVARLRPVSGAYQFPCGGLGSEIGFRPVQAFQSRITKEALAKAPKIVRAAAAADHTRYTTEPLEATYRPEVAGMTSGVNRKLLGWMEIADTVRRGLELREEVRSLPGLPIPGFFR